MTIPTEPRPIGFWLKLVDRLLDERLGVALGDLTRRHWQVLNVVQQGPVNQAGIDERVRPFLTAGATTTSEAEERPVTSLGAGRYLRPARSSLRSSLARVRTRTFALIDREQCSRSLSILQHRRSCRP
jgi:hypothetical protein